MYNGFLFNSSFRLCSLFIMSGFVTLVLLDFYIGLVLLCSMKRTVDHEYKCSFGVGD